MIKQNITNLVLIAITVIAVFVAMVSMKSCHDNKASLQGLISLNKDLQKGADSAKYYRAKNGQIVSENATLNITLTDLKQSNDDLTTQLKNMKLSPGKVQYIDRFVTAYTDTGTHTIKHDTVKVGQCVPFSDSSKWSTIKGIACINSTTIINQVVLDSMYLVLGTNNMALVMHKNPNIITKNILSVQVAKTKKWYDNFWLHLGIGFAGGVYLERYLTK